MSNKKEAIMEAYLQLLDEKAEKRITVNDIVKRCGVSRNTFYYYYSDVSALIDEMQLRWAELVRMPDEPESILDCLTPMVRFAQAHGQGLLRAYQSNSYDRFLRDLNRMWDAVVRSYFKKKETQGIGAEDRELLTRFFKSLFVGVTLDWLDAGMSYDLMETGTRIRRLTDEAARGNIPQSF